MDLLYAVSGFAVGAIVGLTGVGGGSLMTPLLVLLLGVAPATAVGTDLLYAAITKAGGVAVHTRRRHVRWDIVGRLAGGGVPGALLTIGVLTFAQFDHAALSRIVTQSLGVALILTALAILFKQRIQDWGRLAAGAWRERWLGPLTIMVGFVLGVLVTLSSVGAGALGVAALFFLYPRLSTVEIVGSDIAHAVPLTLVAGLGHARLGTVDWALLGSLLVGSLPGIWLGSLLSARVPERVLRSGLASLLAIVGGKLVL
ncbi:MAG: sulfite exporter TauE/SafE family protein [Casimicrobiaceae bacterium]